MIPFNSTWKGQLAGFRVTDTGIESLPKDLDAIREFPTPRSLADTRSWFGLVSQVAQYEQLRVVMAPFKPFLSPKQPFAWTVELERSFESSNSAIVDMIRSGVELRTCLRPEEDLFATRLIKARLSVISIA